MDAARAFDRFYKADTARMHVSTVGAGLGLAIVKEIAQAHAGTVKLNSVLNEGTSVEIALPLAA
jgi:signal transduction histidine kinase